MTLAAYISTYVNVVHMELFHFYNKILTQYSSQNTKVLEHLTTDKLVEGTVIKIIITADD